MFDVIRDRISSRMSSQDPLVVALDDSLLHKRGRKIPGVSYRRDPLGPPFSVNFVRAQRVLQLSAAYDCAGGRARMIPIDFAHAPTAIRPRKAAPIEQWQHYKEEQKRFNLSLQAKQRVTLLREKLNNSQAPQRPLWLVVDGGYTNAKMLKNLPANTMLTGRIRHDAKLYYLPQNASLLGRRKVYGEPAPTPEQLLKDESVPWQTVKVFAVDKYHDFKIKTLAPLRWRSAGAGHDLRLIVIAPLAYRPSKNSKLRYRKPAYLICTGPTAPIEKILQAYVWRWDIEVNFRDEKTLLGVGQAQVRNIASVEKVPAAAVAAYAALLLAGIRAFGNDQIPDDLPYPKWQSPSKKKRASTMDYLRLLRRELWAKAIRHCNFSSFVNSNHTDTKPQKLQLNLSSALFYATG